MKRFANSVIVLSVIVLAFAANSMAMPLHPNVLKNMDPAAKQTMIEQSRDLAARGIDNPSVWKDSGRFLKLDQINRADGSAADVPDTFRVIVLLVDFVDDSARFNPSFFDSLFFGEDFGTVRNFYRTASYNSLVIATDTPCDSVGWLRMPEPYTYYVHNERGFGTYPHNAQKLTEDAIAAADPYVDFSRYDNDGDGYVDGLLVMHAGTGYELSGSLTDIHSHAWVTSSVQSVDGVYAYRYGMQPEFWGFSNIYALHSMTCGVIVHEMGHSIFGLPDLYDTDYTSEGLGTWSLMAGGSWNGPSGFGDSPAMPDVWSRCAMGFATAVDLTANEDSIKFALDYYEPHVLRVWTDGAPSDEYFLLENRRRVGYDASLPGEGLLIYHVDESQATNSHEWTPSNPNNGHYKVALDQADGLFELEQNGSADGSDPWPGSFRRRTFGHFTMPFTDAYSGAPTFVAISNISNPADTMTFDVRLTSLVKAAFTSASLDSATGQVTLNWSPYDTTEFKMTGYEVYRDGLLVGSTSDTTYTDTLDAGGTYSYTVFARDDLVATPASDTEEITWNSTSGVVDDGCGLPASFSLSPAYPNPFNPSTRLTLSLPEATRLTANVYDILGRKVSTLYDGVAQAGRLTLSLDAHSWASGTYIVRVNAANNVQLMRRVTLLR